MKSHHQLKRYWNFIAAGRREVLTLVGRPIPFQEQAPVSRALGQHNWDSVGQRVSSKETVDQRVWGGSRQDKSPCIKFSKYIYIFKTQHRNKLCVKPTFLLPSLNATSESLIQCELRLKPLYPDALHLFPSFSSVYISLKTRLLQVHQVNISILHIFCYKLNILIE